MSIIKNGIIDNNYEKYYLRDAISSSVLAHAQNNKNICFVSANVMSSSRVLESIKLFPERAFNVGISEQEMISFSAGLAQEGFTPFVFTMAPFMSMRACEQVRTDIAYNNLNVRMIATYAGVSGGISGATHWGIEDCAIMRGIPGITVLEPCDPIQAKKMIDALEYYKGPVYIRIGVEPVPNLYDEDISYEIGKANTIMEGDDGAFISSGVLVKYAIMAAQRIEKETGKKIMVIDMHTIKPVDCDAVKKAAKTKKMIVIQDHNIIGGLGDAVASVLVQSGIGIKFRCIGIPDKFIVMAHAPFLYKKYGMDEEGVYSSMMEIL